MSNSTMLTPPIRMVVFDMAGTTVVDNGEITQAFQQALLAAGYAVPTEKITPLMGYEKSEAIRNILEAVEPNTDRITTSVIAKIHQRFLDEMVRYYTTTTQLQPMPGAEDVFDALRKQQVIVALNTGFSKPITDAIRHRLAWDRQKVDFVVSSSEVPKGRPAPYMVQHLMQRAGIASAQHVVKVGDTEVDIREGQNAGCRFSIGVTTGAFSRAELEPYQPSFIIDSLRELLPIINTA